MLHKEFFKILNQEIPMLLKELMLSKLVLTDNNLTIKIPQEELMKTQLLKKLFKSSNPDFLMM